QQLAPLIAWGIDNVQSLAGLSIIIISYIKKAPDSAENWYWLLRVATQATLSTEAKEECLDFCFAHRIRVYQKQADELKLEVNTLGTSTLPTTLRAMEQLLEEAVGFTVNQQEKISYPLTKKGFSKTRLQAITEPSADAEPAQVLELSKYGLKPS